MLQQPGSASKEKAGCVFLVGSYDTHERDDQEERGGIDSVLGLVAHRHRQAGVLNTSDAAPIANAQAATTHRLLTQQKKSESALFANCNSTDYTISLRSVRARE